MPTTDFSQFSLYVATPEQLHEARVRCSEQWAGDLNLKEYLERDRLLDMKDHASNGKLITWYGSESFRTILRSRCDNGSAGC